MTDVGGTGDEPMRTEVLELDVAGVNLVLLLDRLTLTVYFNLTGGAVVGRRDGRGCSQKKQHVSSNKGV